MGFYRKIGQELVLGPFQGPTACTRIAIPKGVCGRCAEEKLTMIIPNVHEFPGHIACSPLSNSEIVVPLVYKDEVKLLLDIDSEQVDDFERQDQEALEAIIKLIGKNHGLS